MGNFCFKGKRGGKNEKHQHAVFIHELPRVFSGCSSSDFTKVNNLPNPPTCLQLRGKNMLRVKKKNSLNIPNCAAETSVHKKNYLPLSRCIFQKEHLMHSNKENNALLCQTLQQRAAICLIPERQFVFFLLGKCCRLTVLGVFHRG